MVCPKGCRITSISQLRLNRQCSKWLSNLARVTSIQKRRCATEMVASSESGANQVISSSLTTTTLALPGRVSSYQKSLARFLNELIVQFLSLQVQRVTAPQRRSADSRVGVGRRRQRIWRSILLRFERDIAAFILAGRTTNSCRASE
jgi:hypothetical protein